MRALQGINTPGFLEEGVSVAPQAEKLTKKTNQIQG